MIVMILVLVWMAIGIWSYIYWWSQDFDIKTSGLSFILIIYSALTGPLSYIICKDVHEKYQQYLKDFIENETETGKE